MSVDDDGTDYQAARASVPLYASLDYRRTPAAIREAAPIPIPAEVWIHLPAREYPATMGEHSAWIDAHVYTSTAVAAPMHREYGGVLLGPVSLVDVPRVKRSRARIKKRKQRELRERPPFEEPGGVLPP